MGKTEEKLQRRAATARHTVHLRPHDTAATEEKMAEVLLRFAEPFLEGTRDDRTWKTALGLAVTSWNIAQHPEDRHDHLIAELKDNLRPAAGNHPETLDFLETTCRTLVERKKTLFPNHTRSIQSYKTHTTGPKVKLHTTAIPPAR